MRKNKGFTLIELLVVIAIIGILASVVLASLNRARRDSRDARRISDVKQIQIALELFFDQNRQYPAYALVPGSGTTMSTQGHIAVLPGDPLMAAAGPTCRITGTGYCYAWDAAVATRYHLGANLENTAHQVFTTSDRNCSSTGNTCFGAAAAGGGFDGAVAGIYDMLP